MGAHTKIVLLAQDSEEPIVREQPVDQAGGKLFVELEIYVATYGLQIHFVNVWVQICVYSAR